MSTGALRVAIVGAGPAGSALAIFLARGGAEVTLFDDERRPELLVGESLVPAIVPILRRLGVEKRTAACGRVKPGTTFIWSERDRVSFDFARFAPAVWPYAYNVPRPHFDDVLLDHAVAAGVTRVVGRARLQPTSGNGHGAELALAQETLAAAPALGGRQPDLIVDATGRARHAARVLGIGAHLGPRKDVAHFAHFENFCWNEPPGQVVIVRGASGWSWCIPLKERLSVGIVLGQEDAARLGRTAEERLERAIAASPWLAPVAGAGRRVTSVATYTNYQLISQRGVGPGWVMVGDTFGFVDPMLSPGVFLALRSAELVADALTPVLERRTPPSPTALASLLRPYAVTQRAALAAWTDLIACLYDGRLLALIRAGRDWMEHGPGPLKTAMQHHIERHIAMQATGAGTTSGYSRTLLRMLSRYGLRGVEPADLAIR
ncbi:MAG TPA: NAD(P)/FAD-dependent oxidoreductase [Methylomirabilota bacterium]|nr:NAD(P)/FAD-dependent oxidoreductase [Methylomirabilota bacterium]